MSFLSERWKKLKDKEYRDGYMEAQFDIELPFQLRALRTARGWTHRQLSKRSGIPEQQLVELEEPGCASFVPDTLCRLASAFDVGLLVQFVSFSHLVRRAAEFRPGTFEVVSFEDDTIEGTVESTGWNATTDTVSTNQQERQSEGFQPTVFVSTTGFIATTGFSSTTGNDIRPEGVGFTDALQYFLHKDEEISAWQISEIEPGSQLGLRQAST